MSSFKGTWIQGDGTVRGLEGLNHADFVRSNIAEFNVETCDEDQKILERARAQGHVQIIEAGADESITVGLTRQITRKAFTALRSWVKQRLYLKRIHFSSDQEEDIGQVLNRQAFVKTRNRRALIRKISGAQSRVQRFHK